MFGLEDELYERIAALEKENERLRDAVEWACKTIDGDDDRYRGVWGDEVNLSWFSPELRQRAGMDEK